MQKNLKLKEYKIKYKNKKLVYIFVKFTIGRERKFILNN